MAGKLTFDEMKMAVAEGRIDTVIAALVDMQGRLMGKRFQAEFFIDEAWKETHGRNLPLKLRHPRCSSFDFQLKH